MALACGTIAFGVMLAIAERSRPDQVSAATLEADDAAIETSDDADVDPLAADVPVDRPVYRYSVIPGGAYDARELARAIDRDPVVAAAYGDVAAGGVHPEIVAADKLAYMSYRIGNNIYWTKHQIRLRRGETILTNGSIELRGRCGNAISLDPMAPTADSEPAPLELEALLAPESRILPSNPLTLGYVTQNGIPLTFGLGAEPGLGSGSSGLPGGFIGGPPSALTPGGPAGTSPQDLVPPFDIIGTPDAPSPSPDIPSFNVPPGSSGDGETPIVLVTIPGHLDSSTVPGFNGGGGNDAGGGNGGGGDDGGGEGLTPHGSTPEGPAAPVPTPEPATFLLIGGGLVSMVARKLRSRG